MSRGDRRLRELERRAASDATLDGDLRHERIRQGVALWYDWEGRSVSQLFGLLIDDYVTARLVECGGDDHPGAAVVRRWTKLVRTAQEVYAWLGGAACQLTDSDLGKGGTA